MIAQDFNCARYRRSQTAGHYESYFFRANHPKRPEAFWIRYTIFNPVGRPHDAIGEVWAVIFDGEAGHHLVAKSEAPIERCEFSTQRFSVRVDDSFAERGLLRGRAASSSDAIVAWDLAYHGDAPPVFDLPIERYDAGFPKAKALVGLPMSSFSGTLSLNGRSQTIKEWVGSQNHNWGPRHTDRYAWGQVCGFDNAPDSFLEIVSAKIKIGPIWSPLITRLVMRHGGREYALNSIWKGLRASASYDYFLWRFATKDRRIQIEGEIRAPREAFVGLNYFNPPGGVKTCLNSKIATCHIRLTNLESDRTEILQTESRAAFEILTDDAIHKVEIRA